MKSRPQRWGLPTTLELRDCFPVPWEFLGENILFLIFFALPWHSCVCVHALSCSVYLTLCNPMDYSPPYPSARGILQARILEWVAISSSRRSFQPRNWTLVSCVSYIGSRILYHHQGSLLMEQGKKKSTDHETREKRSMPGNPKTPLGSKGCLRGGRTSEISVILFLWHCSTNLERSGETLGMYSMKFTIYKYKFGVRKKY